MIATKNAELDARMTIIISLDRDQDPSENPVLCPMEI